MTEPMWLLLIGAVVGFISTYLTAILKLRQDLRAEYDKDLRARRIPAYTLLWQLTDLFPKYGHTSGPTGTEVRSLTISLRDWYFGGGGMFLSQNARDRYFALQDTLSEVFTSVPDAQVDDTTYERVRKSCSDLRSALVRDVGTRHEPVAER